MAKPDPGAARGGSRQRTLLAVAAAGLWSGASEFVRNEVLLPSVWRDHFADLGLTFPAEPLNAAVWVAWSFVFAGVVFAVSRRFGLLATTAIAWVAAFPMMWLVTWNLAVLPPSVLPAAVPLSLLEAFGMAWLCLRLAPPSAR
jgi:hypothetical protein